MSLSIVYFDSVDLGGARINNFMTFAGVVALCEDDFTLELLAMVAKL